MLSGRGVRNVLKSTGEAQRQLDTGIQTPLPGLQEAIPDRVPYACYTNSVQIENLILTKMQENLALGALIAYFCYGSG